MPLRHRAIAPLGLAAVLLATACVRSRATAFDPAARVERRTPPDWIRFYESQKPTCPYKEVGKVTATPGFFGSWERTVHAARERAHELGGDAILQVQEDTRLSGAVWSRGSISTTERTSITGTVIRFTDRGCMT